MDKNLVEVGGEIMAECVECGYSGKDCPVCWDMLADKKIGEIEMTTLTKLYQIQCGISGKDFEEIFKDSYCGWEHLWRQYSTTYRSNLLLFWNYLSTTDRKLSTDFSGWIERQVTRV